MVSGGTADGVTRKRVNGAAKGAEFERKLADYFVSLGYENARRMIRTGTVKHADEGDLDGLPFTVQAKTQAKPVTDAQITAWLTATAAQRNARRHAVGLLIVKRNGHADVGKSWVHTDVLTISYLSGQWHGVNPPFESLLGLRSTFGRFALGELAQLLAWRYPPK